MLTKITIFPDANDFPTDEIGDEKLWHEGSHMINAVCNPDTIDTTG